MIFFQGYSGAARRQMDRLAHVWGLEPGSTTKGENEELRVYRREGRHNGLWGLGQARDGLWADGLFGEAKELGLWCGFQEMNWKWRSESVVLCSLQENSTKSVLFILASLAPDTIWLTACGNGLLN